MKLCPKCGALNTHPAATAPICKECHAPLSCGSVRPPRGENLRAFEGGASGNVRTPIRRGDDE